MTSVWAAVGTTLIMFALKFTIGIRVSEEDEVRTLQISPRLHVLALNDLSCMMIFAPQPSSLAHLNTIVLRDIKAVLT